MPVESLTIKTHGERFYEITSEIRHLTSKLCTTTSAKPACSGILFLWCPHTSCALTISEAYDPSARLDMEEFLKHLAPTHLPFIQHTSEGADDSPSHMKSILLQPSLTLPVEEGELMIGQWQGLYLAEFRKANHSRKIMAKMLFDS